VICLANVVFVFIVMLAASGQFVCHWKFGNSSMGHLLWIRFGGNDVLFINGPVSDFRRLVI